MVLNNRGQTLIPCLGCGAMVPASNGPTHRYLDASPGCWEIFGEVLAREFGEFGYPPVHRMTVDTYAVQHVGRPGLQTIRSVAIHLTGLCLSLECGLSPQAVTEAIGRVRTSGYDLRWLDPPTALGRITIIEVRAAADLEEHTAIVTDWAQCVWRAWSPHHKTVHALVAAIGLGQGERPRR